MGVYPSKYNKNEFVDFLKKCNVPSNVINDFNSLPIAIKYNKNTYKLDINCTWYSIGNTFYNFELNYYSEDIIEFLFPSKVYSNVELSINHLLSEINNNPNLIKIE